jgi:uncharacterized protein YndB with AHSA1/START domain
MAGDFVMSRVFDAPRDLLWQCFTDPKRMQHWWGPKGFTVIASKMDLRVGGTYHYGMKAPNGSTMWGLFTYREIVPQQKLVFINAFSDEKGAVTRHPGHEKWPLQMLSAFTFEDASSPYSNAAVVTGSSSKARAMRMCSRPVTSDSPQRHDSQ